MFENAQTFLQRFAHNEDVPVEDWFFLYNRTTGVYQAPFDFQDVYLMMHDHAGARAERKKWTSFLHLGNIIIFTVDIMSWTRGLFENHRANAMDDSVECFKSLVLSEKFQGHAIILTFTECNTLQSNMRDHLPGKDLESYASSDTVEGARLHLAQIFLRQLPPRRLDMIHVAFTDLSDGLTRPAEILLGTIREICNGTSTPPTGPKRASTLDHNYLTTLDQELDPTIVET